MIKFKNIKKSYKDTEVIKGINLSIDQGEFIVFIGPSGCGKTTCLKMINRLITPTEGEILINGKNIAHENPIHLRRNIGYVIQQTGLFPHMTVRQNISLVPKLENWDSSQITTRVMELMDMIGMEPSQYLDRYPKELSGGQQQRIGVARAFAVDPDIILMDEPFSALDPISRNQLQDELYELQQKMKKTIVFVTHDISEAIKLADRICLMKDGKIVQFDTPENLLKNPVAGFAEEFIGKNRIWETPEYIKASDIMISDPVKAVKGRSCLQGLEIMKSNNVDSLLIVDETQHLIGTVSSNSIKRVDEKSTKLLSIMNQQFITVQEDTSLLDVIQIMNENKMQNIAVTDENMLLKGLITKASLLKVLIGKYIEGGNLDE